MWATLRSQPLLPRAPRHALSARRLNATLAADANAAATEKATLFVSSVYPLRLGWLDLRYSFARMAREDLEGNLRSVLNEASAHRFAVKRLSSSPKFGGIFVDVEYQPAENTASDIRQAVEAEAAQRGGIKTWIGIDQAHVWVVKGEPWQEDLRRFVTQVLRVEFEGPDVHEEDLYTLMRPYGRIYDITAPVPGSAGNPRHCTVSFLSQKQAAIAHSCLHGVAFTHKDGKVTRLKTSFVPPGNAHWIRDWIVNHPRVTLPIALFLFGTLTYTIFDPIRTFFVEGRLMGWFDYKEFSFVKWLRANTVDQFHWGAKAVTASSPLAEAWKDREKSEETLKNYLADYPTTVTFVSGPAGSGKTTMTESVIKDQDRRSMVIDCADLYRAGTDSALLSSLARQTGYRPLFTWVNNLNDLIDLASVGLIGQKTGFSSSLTKQVRDMLQVVTAGLQGATSQHDKKVHKRERADKVRQQQDEHEREVVARIKRGAYHDGRIDCIAGNGVMSELGLGDEPMLEQDYDAEPKVQPAVEDQQMLLDQETQLVPVENKSKYESVPENVKALPVVVIKNFAARGAQKEEIVDALAEWASALVDNQIAHVIVLSDNRENGKRLAKSMPTKPLIPVTLADADPDSAIAYVTSKLSELGWAQSLSKEQVARVQMLGGRASDLQRLIHKVHSGQRVEEAVDDIISRGVSELRKNAFGDDLEDAKSLQWTREQAWSVVKQLAHKPELSYFDVLLEFPFKGDEAALRAMEHAELISISTHDGRPSGIRPGRPVYKFVFQHLVDDALFQATQDLAYNEKAIASAESTVKACEAEMTTLKELASESSTRRAANARAKYLSNKMQAAQTKIEQLEAKNAALHKVISREH
ncbi:exonuclease [Auricularia subglabra TFB-10046 SS5]|nr:exonuclease [Auricularia subglabra TFB-10046 SS5]